MTFTAGICDGMPDGEYHADPVPGGSLSSTGARALLPPSCPALYRYHRDHPVVKDVFDFGTAAHRLILGTGPEIEVVPASDWRTQAAKDARDSCRADGVVPLLATEWRVVQDMREAIRAHPIAGKLLTEGTPEQSMFWQDAPTDVWCRGRIDWETMTSRGPVITDYKTAASADPDRFARSVVTYGYHIQAAWYTDGYAQLTGNEPGFLFIVQEKTPPFLVSVCQLDELTLSYGRGQARAAREIYRDCTDADIWPGYATDITQITLPPWARPREDWS